MTYQEKIDLLEELKNLMIKQRDELLLKPIQKITPQINAVVIRIMDDGSRVIHIECKDNKKEKMLMSLANVLNQQLAGLQYAGIFNNENI